jgi:ferritin-like metal-binding protein YciE
MQTGHELFVHELADIMDGERQLVDALRELENDSTNPQLKKAFAEHREQTEGQIERLEQCFSLLGEQPENTECAGIKGLVEEKKSFMDEKPSDDILDIFQVGAGIKTESYEICAYESLVQLAQEMKHTKVAQLLNQNLKEEQATLKKLEGFSKKLKPEQMMTEEQEERASTASRSRKKPAA